MSTISVLTSSLPDRRELDLNFEGIKNFWWACQAQMMMCEYLLEQDEFRFGLLEVLCEIWVSSWVACIIETSTYFLNICDPVLCQPITSMSYARGQQSHPTHPTIMITM